MTFRVMVGHLGQRLRRGDADGDRNPGVTPHPAPQVPTFREPLRLVTCRQFKKGLINGITFHMGDGCFEGAHHPVAHVPVKRIVRGKNIHPLSAQLILDLEYRCPHRNTQRL